MQIIPSGEFAFIQEDDISSLEFEANVLLDDNDDYFTITELADEVTA